MSDNSNLHNARNKKDDEFYTPYEIIEKELVNYKENFENKVIYLNTDNSKYSNFWKYFYNNFDKLKIKELVSTYYKEDSTSYKTIYNGEDIIKEELESNGDFRNRENIDILKESDIVITNPPLFINKGIFKSTNRIQ